METREDLLITPMSTKSTFRIRCVSGNASILEYLRDVRTNESNDAIPGILCIFIKEIAQIRTNLFYFGN